MRWSISSSSLIRINDHVLTVFLFQFTAGIFIQMTYERWYWPGEWKSSDLRIVLIFHGKHLSISQRSHWKSHADYTSTGIAVIRIFSIQNGSMKVIELPSAIWLKNSSMVSHNLFSSSVSSLLIPFHFIILCNYANRLCTDIATRCVKIARRNDEHGLSFTNTHEDKIN